MIGEKQIGHDPRCFGHMTGSASAARVDRTNLALNYRCCRIGSFRLVMIGSESSVAAQTDGIVAAQTGVGIAMGVMAGQTRQRTALLVAGAPRQCHPLKTRHAGFGMRIIVRGIFRSAMTIAANCIDARGRGAVQVFHAVGFVPD